MITLSIILVVLLLNLLIVFREKRLRRIAEAKLEIVSAVTELEEMMLTRQICAGSICHDKFHKKMLATQYAEHFGIDFMAFLKRSKSPEWEKEKEMIHHEISKNNKLGKLLERHISATFKAFTNEHPVVAFAFWMWVIIRAGGLLMLVACVLAVLQTLIFTKKAMSVMQAKRHEFKSNALECYAATRLEQIG